MNDAQVAKGARSDDVLGLHAFRACGYSPVARSCLMRLYFQGRSKFNGDRGFDAVWRGPTTIQGATAAILCCGATAYNPLPLGIGYRKETAHA